MELRIFSWNVNGFRACLKKGFYDFLINYNPDILCLQEIKQSKKPILPLNFPKYHVFWNPAKRKGYAGTAVFSKLEPNDVRYGIGIDEFDDEGRVIILEFQEFYLINAYFPNAQRELKRLDFKLRFNKELTEYIENLRKEKPIILCGDFNVAHKEIDLARPKDNVKNAGFTPQERAWMDYFLKLGYIDTFRHLHPKEIKYSWWTYRFKARERNIGWRVDYIVISKELLPNLKDAFILDHVQGSDHAPIGVIMYF